MKLLAILFCLTIALPASAQYWGRCTQSLYSNEAVDVEIDQAGNQYVAGYLMGTTGFDAAHLQTASGGGDIYVAKYAPNGDLIWLRKFGANLPDRAYDLAVGPDQHPVITGQFSGSVTFDATTLSSVAGSKDIFVLKLDPSGNVAWARQEGGSMTDTGFGVTVDLQNNVIVTGQFQGSVTIAGQPFTSLPDPVTLSPGFDLFISKYTASGTPLWARSGQADYEDKGIAVHTDAQNNIFLAGQFSDTLVLAGQTYNNVLFNVGLFARFTPTGTLQWMYPLKAGTVTPHDLEVNAANEVILTGDFTGNMTYTDGSGDHAITNPYPEQIFVLKTANNGSYTWNKTYGSHSDVSARSLAIDDQNDIYVTGWFKCEFEELQNGDEAIFNSVGYKDPYLIKVSNSGQTAYAKHIGGKLDDEGHGVAIAQPDMPVLCGGFTLDLNLRTDDILPYAIGPDAFSFDVVMDEPLHVYLHGDSTRNSFLMKAVHPQTPELNFFHWDQPDSLFGDIVGYIPVLVTPDTIHFCGGGLLAYATNTPPHLGPSYNFLWENGTTAQSNALNGEGMYFVHVERDDACVAYDDTVQVVIHSFPHLPLMTDNLGMADSTLEYPNYFFCEDDSVQVWFTNYDPDATTTIDVWPPLINDSLPHYYGDGTYHLFASNEWCSTEGLFTIEVGSPGTYDPILPYLSIGGSDTATICLGEYVTVWVLDSLTNPTGVLETPEEPVALFDWIVDPTSNGNDDNYHYVIFPDETGWYTFDYTVSLGFITFCDVDTTRFHVLDSFYFIVHPLPEIDIPIVGEPLLCPGGSATIYVTATHPDFDWSGPGIAWTSTGNDSIEAVSPGTYVYGGILTIPQTGCSASFYFPFNLLAKDPPAVLSAGGETIICPGDSILMAVPDMYTDYLWIGPQNDTLSTAHEVYGSTPGLYACTVIDDDGCELNTVPFYLFSWTPPYLVTEPSDILCEGETIELTAVYSGSAGVQWTTPVSSTAESITVAQPGAYICEVQQCGMTITDTVVIIDGSFDLPLTVSDTTLCYGESAVITASGGYSYYQWSDGNSGSLQLVTQEAGSYWLTATNNYGCEAVSDTVDISLWEGSEPPAVIGTTICPGEDVTLTDQSAFTANWFSADTIPAATGPSITLTGITGDTVVLVAYSVNECPFAFQSVAIDVTDSLPSFFILGDSLLCPGETAVFTSSLSGLTQTWLHDGTVLGNGNSVTVNATVFASVPVISLAVSNSCFSDTVHEAVLHAVPQTVSLPEDSLIVCAYSETALELNEDVDATYWLGNFGTLTGNELTVVSSFGNGWIYASAVDLNGCATNTDSVYLTVSTLAYSLWSELGNACHGDSVSFGITTSADSLIWDTPNGFTDTTFFGFSVNAQNGGWYNVTQWDAIGCVYEDSLFVPVNTLPVFDLGTDTVLCINDVYTYYFPDDTNTFTWTGYGPTLSFPVTAGQWAILTATSPQGCAYADTLYIEAVDCDGPLPNVITPNGDGINDFFFLDDALANPGNRLIILNRWGNVMFETTGYANDFDGRNISDGVYFYIFYPDPARKPGIKKHGFLHIGH